MATLTDLQAWTRKSFATTYGFLLLAQCYHWNIEGDKSSEYFDLFGKIYNEVDKKLEPFADHVRSVRAYVPSKFANLMELSSVDTDPEYKAMWPTPEEMIYNLYLANGKVNTDLVTTYKMAEELEEFGLANFLTERMDQHRKHGWMLYSQMKVEDYDK